MNCPKCKTPIDEKDLVCPNCKKVLRLQCPVCGAVTKNTICDKCGNVILNKCYKCGRLNATTLEKCPKCGLDINASIGLRESFIEEFAALTIEITNFDDIKHAFKSDKMLQKFKKNFYEMIKKTASQKKLRVQFLEDTFIIRFCKDYSFLDSCRSAVDFSIYIAQTVTEINKKLFDAKGIELKTQMAIQKRDVYSKPSEYKSGLNINVVYSSSANAHRFHNTEVVVDSYVYHAVKLYYPFQSLSAVYVKNCMVMFFELILHQIIKPQKEKKIDINKISLPKNVDYEPEEEQDDSLLINFKSLNCTFMKAKQPNLLNEIAKIKNKNITNPIISVRSTDRDGKLRLISTEQIQEIFSDYNAVRFSCPKSNKYTAFGLFKQMILAYRGLDDYSVLSNPSLINEISQDNDIKDLFKMKITSKAHPEDMRYAYFDSFTKFITSIPYKTIFIIDDFENADEGSLDIIKYLFENNTLTNVGFIVSCGEDYSLHRKIYRLMTAPNYFEIEIRPSSNKNIIQNHINKLQNIQGSFFIEKILENTKGSFFYFNEALKYLRDDSVIALKDNKYEIAKEQMIVIPYNLDELIQKRIQYLKTVEDTFELFAYLLLTGERLPISIISSLGIKDSVKLLKHLEENEFIKIINEREVVINNYNLCLKNFLAVCEKTELQKIAKELLEKIYLNIQIPNSTKASLLEFANLKKEAFAHWHALAMISGQIGDFCAYLNCTNKFLSLVENVIDIETDKTVEEVKMDVYTELASLMYKYYPDKILTFLQTLLSNTEIQNDDKKVREVANKLVQSCLMSGNYNNALEYVGQLISRTTPGSFNPKDKNFNLNYFLVNLVTLEIYFNLGRLNECIDLGDELFKYINLNTISESVLPEGFSKKQFEDAILDALFFISASRIIQLKPDAQDYLNKVINSTPAHYTCFKLLMLFREFFAGVDITAQLAQFEQEQHNDKYSEILIPILKSLTAWKKQEWENLANYIYDAKLKSSYLQLHQIESFCNLMIGLAYQNLSNTKKAKQIFYSILELSEEKGLKNITYLSWLLIAGAEFLDGNIEMSVGLLNNAVLNIESDENASRLFILMFKILSAEITIQLKSNIEQALFCAEQAFDIAYKEKLFVYLPRITNMLMYIYNVIINSQSDENTRNHFIMKLENLNKIMSQFS